MKRIDSHQHFWRFNTVDYAWMDNRMDILKKDYLPEDLKREQDHIDFHGSVAIQARQTDKENEFLLHLAGKYRFIKGIVGWINLQAENVEERLEYYSQYRKFCGVRHVIHDEPDKDFILRPAFLYGISKLAEYELTYDILIFEEHLLNTIRFVEKFPDQKFVIDHIAKPRIRDQIIEPWAERMREIAKYENVYCKVSGLVTEADWGNWKPEDFYPYLDTVFDAFGTDRIMIGSDWPVCLLAGDYERVMKVVMDYIKQFPGTAYQNIIGKNCIRFYGLNK